MGKPAVVRKVVEFRLASRGDSVAAGVENDPHSYTYTIGRTKQCDRTTLVGLDGSALNGTMRTHERQKAARKPIIAISAQASGAYGVAGQGVDGDGGTEVIWIDPATAIIQSVRTPSAP